MAATDRPGPTRSDAHRDSKTGKTEPTRHLSNADKAAIINSTGADFINVTEIIIKYEILRKGQKEPIPMEISLDPGAFDAVILSPQKCDQVDPPADGSLKRHRVLKADGTGKGWEEVRRQHGEKVGTPRESKERGKFNSEHSPLCIHDGGCNWYCVRDSEEEFLP
jgi:hypothetical protein